MAHQPTIYEALKEKLGREPSTAEIKEDVHRILREGTAERTIERAEAGKRQLRTANV